MKSKIMVLFCFVLFVFSLNASGAAETSSHDAIGGATESNSKADVKQAADF